MSVTLIGALAAGVLSAFSPCVLPVAPAILAGCVGHRLRPIAVVSGMGLTFVLMYGALKALTVSTGASSETLRTLSIAVIFLFGVVMLSESVNAAFSSAVSRVTSRAHVSRSEEDASLFGAFVLGASLGIVWLPCIGPVLGAILGLAVARSSVLLAVYFLGLAVPLLALAYGGKTMASRLEPARKHSAAMERAAGAVLILTAAAMLLGLDRWVQATLL